MVMNPRTHPRGKAPDFALPKPNPNPDRMTDALWWLVCMREALEPTLSENGGTLALKPGYHSYGSRLPDHGLGNSETDHSIRRAPDRSGSWWRSKTSAHDWTFLDAQRGDYRTINKYTKRLVNAMRDPKDLRPDEVYAYTLGQIDGDRVVEGYNEYRDEDEHSGDITHLWHRHDSFRRNIIGLFQAMWKALTIDMGWTYAEWQQSVAPPAKPPVEEDLPVKQADYNALFLGALNDKTIRAELGEAMLDAVLGSDGDVAPKRTLRAQLRDLGSRRAVDRFPADHPEVQAAKYPADSPAVKLLALPNRPPAPGDGGGGDETVR